MAETERRQPVEETKRHPAFWPAIVSGVLLLLCCLCVWQLYRRNSEQAELASARLAEYERLRNEAEELRKLLRLSPCEAKEKAPASISALPPQP